MTLGSALCIRVPASAQQDLSRVVCCQSSPNDSSGFTYWEPMIGAPQESVPCRDLTAAV